MPKQLRLRFRRATSTYVFPKPPFALNSLPQGAFRASLRPPRRCTLSERVQRHETDWRAPVMKVYFQIVAGRATWFWRCSMRRTRRLSSLMTSRRSNDTTIRRDASMQDEERVDPCGVVFRALRRVDIRTFFSPRIAPVSIVATLNGSQILGGKIRKLPYQYENCSTWGGTM